MKFNIRLGRKVTYRFYPYKKFEIIKDHHNGKVDIAIGTWRILCVPVIDLCRTELVEQF